MSFDGIVIRASHVDGGRRWSPVEPGGRPWMARGVTYELARTWVVEEGPQLLRRYDFDEGRPRTPVAARRLTLGA